MSRVQLSQYETDDGRITTLSGNAVSPQRSTVVTKSWVDKRHPQFDEYAEDELRQRASYVATRRLLAQFLVPHRFEGRRSGEELNRARLGFGIRLNQPYVNELFGHIRSAPIEYSWGVLSPTTEVSARPEDGSDMGAIWRDCTGNGESWTSFFERRVLEWMLTSPGGLIVVDSKEEEGRTRARLQFAPWSWVEDFGWGREGLTYVKLEETIDQRDPREKEDDAFEKRHVLYLLDESGDTIVARYDEDGEAIAFDDGETERNLGSFVNEQGKPTLPLIVVGYGEHPTVAGIGSGLLMGLDDIVIDLYNLMSEIREGYRDVCFGVIVHKGPDGEIVQEKLENGTRFLTLGDHEQAMLQRLSAESAEVDAGLSLVTTSLESWRMSAKRKVAESMERAVQSGVSMKAEFQLDSRPLLIEITEMLDDIETKTLQIVAQTMNDALTKERMQDISVARGTSFNLEDEAERITRIVRDALEVFPIPSELKTRLALRWVEESDMLDLDEPIETLDENGELAASQTLRDVIEEELRSQANAADRAAIQQSQSVPPLDELLFGAPPGI